MEFIKIERKDNYAIINMDRGKVNALTLDMIQEIRETFKAMEADEEIRGVLLCGKPKYFSAGLDLIELVEYDKAKMNEFFIAFSSMHLELARFTKPFVCAVTGHSPAGGTVIAITADYRVMADDPKFTIGLNEMAVNIQISNNLISAYTHWIGTSKANEYVLDGKLLNPQEALSAGLVNAICPVEEVVAKAESKLKQYLNAEPRIFKNTKAKLRKSWLDNIIDESVEELKQAEDLWWDPEVRMRLQFFVASFTNKKKA